MMRALRRFARDHRGVAAVELALVAPILAGLTFAAFEVWRYTHDVQTMKDAVTAGVQYYMNGGRDDDDAKAIAEAAWASAPEDAAVAISRACLCGTAAHTCTTLCSNSTVPEIRVTLQATATYDRTQFASNLSETQVIRVR
jgi:Flp pilus assembly protein TadG